MQMTPRRTHKKTRSGCVQCKRRKVKCGEEGCPCKNCLRRGLSCTYVRSALTDTGTPDTATGSPQPHPPKCEQNDPTTLGDTQHIQAGLNRQEELCLIHYYTTSTHLGNSREGTSADIEAAKVWRDMPFQDGLAYPFVLEAVLAVAAIHKALLEPEHMGKYMAACLNYQNQCLCAYQAHLGNINEDNCHAVFAVSTLVLVLNTAVSRGGPTLLPTPPIETLLSQIRLGRGIRAVLDSSFQTIRSAHYGRVLVSPGANTPPDAVNTPEVAYAIEEVKRCIAEAEMPESTTCDVYLEPVESLDDIFRMVEVGKDFGAITMWAVLLSQEVVRLLEERDPLMMLICIHYGVLCLHIHDRWWAHNFGCRLIWDLSERLHALDASWLPLTSWARSKATSVRAASADVQVW